MRLLQSTLHPLVSTVIAFVPQCTCEELLALREADCIRIESCGPGGRVEVWETGEIVSTCSDDRGEVTSTIVSIYIDCSGQPHLDFEEFPFRGLKDAQCVAPARLRFRSLEAARALQEQGVKGVTRSEEGVYMLDVPGVAISDDFEALSPSGEPHPRLFVMSPALMGGHNPDYSGLDFCESAARRIVAKLFAHGE